MVSELTSNELMPDTTCSEGTAKLHVVQIHPTLQCNLRCRHCYSDSGPELRGNIDLENLDHFLAYAAGYGFNVVSVSGGEPFIYKDLEALLQISHSHGYKNMSATNGMLFKSERAKRCLANLDLIAFSIDGDEPLHDDIRNLPGAYKKMLEGVEIAKEVKIPFGFIHTITEHSWDKLIPLAEFAFQQGARLLQLHPLELAGRAVKEYYHLLPGEETLYKVYIIANYLISKYAQQMQIHLDFYHRNTVLNSPKAVSWFGGDFKVTTANMAEVMRSIVVTPDGNILPLSYGFSEQFIIGNIADISTGKDIFSEFVTNKGQKLYNIFASVYKQIENDADTDIITWTERILKQSHKQLQPQFAAG